MATYTTEELKIILDAHREWWMGNAGQRAYLQRADLQGAYLQRADLQGVKINWQSHDMIAATLFRAAGEDIEKRKISGLILISRDWCWKEFLEQCDPWNDWALDVLAEYARDDPGAPAIFRVRGAKRSEGK